MYLIEKTSKKNNEETNTLKSLKYRIGSNVLQSICLILLYIICYIYIYICMLGVIYIYIYKI